MMQKQKKMSSLTPEEARAIRLALIFGDPKLADMPDPGLEEAKRKLWLIEIGRDASK